jgi:hypothetical protein
MHGLHVTAADRMHQPPLKNGGQGSKGKNPLGGAKIAWAQELKAGLK